MRRLLSLGGAALLLAAGLPAAEAGTGGTTTRVSVSSTGAEGNGQTLGARHGLSADGRFVVFTSGATTLVPGDDNGSQDAFLHDRGTGTTSFVGLSSSGELGIYGSGGPAISANGQVVAFGSGSPNLVPDDDNSADDVFLRNLKTGVTTRVSVGHEGQEGNAHAAVFSVSADGNVRKGGVRFRSASLSRDDEWGIASEAIEEASKNLVEELATAERLDRVSSAAGASGGIDMRVVRVDGQRAYINVGSAAGIKVGDKFTIHRQGEELIDPATGMSLGAVEEQVGQGEVVEVQDRFAIITFTGQAGNADVIKRAGGGR